MTKLKKAFLSLLIVGAIGLTVAQLNVSIRDLMGTSLPGTCTVGQRYFKTDATAGQNLYGCTATNTWTVLGDGGGSGSTSGLTLLEQKTASSSSSLDFTSCLTSTYDTYQIMLTDIVTSSNDVVVGIQVSTDGGSTWVTTSSYGSARVYYNYSGGSLGESETTTYMKIFQSVNSAAFGHLSATITLHNPLSSSGYKRFNITGSSSLASGGFGFIGSGNYISQTAINAFRIIPASGTLTSGYARCYGFAK